MASSIHHITCQWLPHMQVGCPCDNRAGQGHSPIVLLIFIPMSWKAEGAVSTWALVTGRSWSTLSTMEMHGNYSVTTTQIMLILTILKVWYITVQCNSYTIVEHNLFAIVLQGWHLCTWVKSKLEPNKPVVCALTNIYTICYSPRFEEAYMIWKPC